MFKYPGIRPSVFGDLDRGAAYESWMRPEDMPDYNTHTYKYEPILAEDAINTASNIDVHSEPLGPTVLPISVRCVALFDRPTHSGIESDDDNVDISPVVFNSVCAEGLSSCAVSLEEMWIETSNFEVDLSIENWFLALEDRWFRAFDAEERRQLCRMVYEAEVDYALYYGIYCKILVGYQTLEGVTKIKTRNRHQTRKRQQRCIGLPEEGRAAMILTKNKAPRCRLDVESRHVLCWDNFRKENAHLPFAVMMDKWKRNPRIRRTLRSRRYRSEALSWTDTVRRFGDYYDGAELYRWFGSLPLA